MAASAAAGVVQLAAAPGGFTTAHGAVGHRAARGGRGGGIRLSNTVGAGGTAVPTRAGATRRRGTAGGVGAGHRAVAAPLPRPGAGRTGGGTAAGAGPGGGRPPHAGQRPGPHPLAAGRMPWPGAGAVGHTRRRAGAGASGGRGGAVGGNLTMNDF